MTAVSPTPTDQIRIWSIQQPWANLIIPTAGTDALLRARNRADLADQLPKNIENRTQPHPHRGLTLIHASASRYDHTAMDWFGFNPAELVYGRVIGVVNIIDCVQNADSPWAMPDAWHFVLANPRPLRYPVLFTGGLGLRRASKIDPVALSKVLDQLEPIENLAAQVIDLAAARPAMPPAAVDRLLDRVKRSAAKLVICGPVFGGRQHLAAADYLVPGYVGRTGRGLCGRVVCDQDEVDFRRGHTAPDRLADRPDCKLCAWNSRETSGEEPPAAG